jgi:hypothetical protein
MRFAHGNHVVFASANKIIAPQHATDAFLHTALPAMPAIAPATVSPGIAMMLAIPLRRKML